MKIRRVLIMLSLILILSVPVSHINYNYSKNIIFTISDAVGYQSEKKVTLDERGVPYVEYKYQNGEYVGEKRRNPVTISQTAREYLNYYYETDEDVYKILFLNCSDWLVENAVVKGNYSVWEYSDVISYPNFKLYPPWVSAMAQGQGIVVLAYAYKLTNNEKYLRTSESSLHSFYVSVEEGGVLQIDQDGGWWYLEYAYRGQPKPRTLNGFIFALIGLHEYYEITGDTDALLLFNRGADELKKHLEDYDTGSYTVYDLVGTPASKKYHQIHVRQMYTMYNLTGDLTFLQYHNKWKGYQDAPYNIIKKNILNRLNICVYILNVVLIIFILLSAKAIWNLNSRCK